MATSSLARDRGLVALVQKRLAEGMGICASTAGAIEELSAMFAAAGGLMAERVTDLQDIRDRVVAELTGQPEPGIPKPEVESVLCADDLAPADTAGLDPASIAAIATSLAAPRATPRSSPASSAFPVSSAQTAWTTSPRAQRCSSTARPAKSSSILMMLSSVSASRPLPPSAPPPRRGASRAQRRTDIPSTSSRTSRRRRCAQGCRDPRPGRGPVPHRAVLPRPGCRAHG